MRPRATQTLTMLGATSAKMAVNASTNSSIFQTKDVDPKKKRGSTKMKSLLAHHDVRVGSITGRILDIRPIGKSSKSGQVGDMSTKGGVKGSGNLPTHKLIVAIMDLDKVKLETCGIKLEEKLQVTGKGNGASLPFVPLFRKDDAGRLHVTYCMREVVDTEIKSKKKIWEAHLLPDKLDYVMRNGDILWVTVWNASGMQIGGQVMLNFMVTQKKNEISTKIMPNCMEFADYYIQVDATPVSDTTVYPLHAKLRSSWPLCSQSFPTAVEVAKEIQWKRDNQNYMKLGASEIRRMVDDIVKKSESNEGDGDLELSAKTITRKLPLRRPYVQQLTHSYLLSVNTINCPCWDEYDPTVVDQSLLDPKFTRDLQAEAQNDLTKCCYYVNCEWFDYSDLKFIYKEPSEDSDKSPYLIMTMNIGLTSWGYLGCHHSSNYKNPVGRDRMVDFATGLVEDRTKIRLKAEELGISQDEVIEKKLASCEYYQYNFKRTIAYFNIWGNNATVGPSNLLDIAKIMVSHPIPFDALLELQRDSTDDRHGCDQLLSVKEAISELEKSRTGEIFGWSGETKNVTTKEDFDTFKEKEAEEAEIAEMARWKKLNTEYARGVLEGSMPNIPQDKDGTLLYNVRTISWRVPEYLAHVGGILLTLEQMNIIYADLVDMRGDDVRDSVINKYAVVNSEGFVFLNDLKTLPSSLPKTYSFYALVCYADKIGTNEKMRTQNKIRLEEMIKLSKAEMLEQRDLTEAEVAKITQYCQEVMKSIGSVFYYAVDDMMSNRCKILAKRNYFEQLKTYGTKERYDVLFDDTLNQMEGRGGGGDGDVNGATTTTTTNTTTTTTTTTTTNSIMPPNDNIPETKNLFDAEDMGGLNVSSFISNQDDANAHDDDNPDDEQCGSQLVTDAPFLFSANSQQQSSGDKKHQRNTDNITDKKRKRSDHGEHNVDKRKKK